MVSEKNCKLLKKMRAWRSELEEDGVTADLEMLRNRQSHYVHFMPVGLVQIAIWSRIGEGGDWGFWITILFFGLVVCSYWRWWRLEKCRAEIEDFLANGELGFDADS